MMLKHGSADGKEIQHLEVILCVVGSPTTYLEVRRSRSVADMVDGGEEGEPSFVRSFFRL